MQAVFSLNLCPCANVALFQECCVQQTEQTEVRSSLNLKLPSSTLDLVEYVSVWPLLFYQICTGDFFYFLISINMNKEDIICLLNNFLGAKVRKLNDERLAED